MGFRRGVDFNDWWAQKACWWEGGIGSGRELSAMGGGWEVEGAERFWEG